MATDQSPPRNGMIFAVSMASVGLLVAIKPVLDIYYDVFVTKRQEAAIATQPAYQLDRLRAAARAQLAAGEMPIERAVEALSRGRMASQAIAPQASNDGAAIIGWSNLPAFVSTSNKNWTAPPPPAPEPVVDPAAVAADPSAPGVVPAAPAVPASPTPAAPGAPQ